MIVDTTGQNLEHLRPFGLERVEATAHKTRRSGDLYRANELLENSAAELWWKSHRRSCNLGAIIHDYIGTSCLGRCNPL